SSGRSSSWRPMSNRTPCGKSNRDSSYWGHPEPPPASIVSPKSTHAASRTCRIRRGPVRDFMTAAIHGCSLILAHAPDLVRHGSKPTRENAAEQIAPKLRTFDAALGYPPHQVFLGNLRPDALW